MKKQELINLKKELYREQERRKQINILLNNKDVIQFLKLQNTKYDFYDEKDIWNMLKNILLKFEITESNGILVCTGNYYTRCQTCYQDTDYYEEPIPFDTKFSEYRTYKDIENGNGYTAYLDKYIEEEIKREADSYYVLSHQSPKEYCEKHGEILVSDIENRFIVLNPTNSNENYNGYNEIRKDFFMNVIEKGQPKTKQLILSKYNIMK